MPGQRSLTMQRDALLIGVDSDRDLAVVTPDPPVDALPFRSFLGRQDVELFEDLSRRQVVYEI